MITSTTPRHELEAAIESEHQLEADLNAIAVGNGLKSWRDVETNELRDQIRAWIEQGDECASC